MSLSFPKYGSLTPIRHPRVNAATNGGMAGQEVRSTGMDVYNVGKLSGIAPKSVRHMFRNPPTASSPSRSLDRRTKRETSGCRRVQLPSEAVRIADR
jgi:hypothetical protein